MRRIYKTIVVGAIAALAVVSGPAAAPAQDGKLHAWEHPGGPPGHGFHCSWEFNDADWVNCPEGHNMKNEASDLWNNGTFLPNGNDEVNLYYNEGYGGAWACIGLGHRWDDLTTNRWIFSWGPSGSRTGHGLSVENNIASHKWVHHCGAS